MATVPQFLTDMSFKLGYLPILDKRVYNIGYSPVVTLNDSVTSQLVNMDISHGNSLNIKNFGMKFNGANSYVDLDTHILLDNNPKTHIIWFRQSESSNVETFFDERAHTGANRYYIRKNDSNTCQVRYRFDSTTGVALDSSNEIKNNEINFLIVKLSEEIYSIQLNDILTENNATRVLSDFTSNRVHFGIRLEEFEPFNGTIFSSMVFNKILDDKETQELIERGPDCNLSGEIYGTNDWFMNLREKNKLFIPANSKFILTVNK